MQLSRDSVRLIMLATQNLLEPPKATSDKEGVLNTIRQMGVLQIDTINVIARSPYLVLWSRVGEYNATLLESLLAEGNLFEYWSHEACFLPIEDYPLYRRLMLDKRKGWHPDSAWVEENKAEIEYVIERIRNNGAARSADFLRKDGLKASGWWDWKPEKIILEYLFNSGELMIAARPNFHRVYELRERILPHWEDSSTPAYSEVIEGLVLKTVQALGITHPRWIADYFRLKKKEIPPLLEKLVSENRLKLIEVEGWDSSGYYHPDNHPLIQQATEGSLDATHTTLLSPFDPLVWDRNRARELFDFNYTIECYTPAPKRQYGYFSLPILWRGKLIGRLDPKAHRRERLFEIKSLHFEPQVQITDEIVKDVTTAIKQLAIWHKTPEVIIRHSNPPELVELFSKEIN
ncbi:MAG: winged helix-turn-helix domain-containing protein [Chloroflexi bacterium]|uniref:Winged helix DNA-binding domain-containing protein n=1 Tax=Candidatus Chlorohelix allophototropha TaxID=3003348 RepID=A0A8T7M1I7_9CHLR|nr:winged helix-turn-helix domain-containing protein [Chloroflexota bacterium]WJW66485.1 winged helix DNA-binding domain-containing protein [Chloroflexota bacterium L227-S17]